MSHWLTTSLERVSGAALLIASYHPPFFAHKSNVCILEM